jgi:hypothetical protein
MTDRQALEEALQRIARALDRLAPEPAKLPDWAAADASVWNAAAQRLEPAPPRPVLPLSLLKGVDRQAAALLSNTQRFAAGLPANHVLLWGARGMGKSALVRATHDAVCQSGHPLKLVQVSPADLSSLPALWSQLAERKCRAILFCDDLAFDGDDTSYRAAKSLLDGGVRQCPGGTIFYATSNRRHLVPREIIENEQASAIHATEAVDEKVSLSDRFGLWLGFHPCTQQDYLDIVSAYASWFAIPIAVSELNARALAWSSGRGARSGRVAWQFIQDLAGELGVRPPT